MVQSLSLCTSTSSINGGVYGSNTYERKHLKLSKNLIASMIGRSGIFHRFRQGFFLSSKANISRQRNCEVKAGWMFKGGGKRLDASSEYSDRASEDILFFFFQLDLATRVQYALNTEQYEIAQQLRNKLTEVEAEAIKQQDSKRGLSSKSEAQDKALSTICLRGDLQKAIDGENYDLAAQLRDEISKLEAESLAASAKALAYENAQYSFRLGQKVKHKIFGYRAVVCGMDPVCCESSSWMETAQVEKLSQGSAQPFYQVRLDK